MSVTDNQLAIDSSLPLDAAPLVKRGMPVAIGDQYDLTIDGGPANKVNYPYGLDLTVEGRGIPTIDPEVEYDNDF